MISELLKEVMRERGLKQSDLVELFGVSLSRVKAMTSGRVKNLTREEGEALIKKLHVRGDWLSTGEGPMFQSDGEREMHRRLDIVKGATGKASVQGLSKGDAARLAEILFFLEMGDAAALQAALNPLTNDELALVQSYRNCTIEGRAHLIQTAALFSAGLAPSEPSKPKTRSKETTAAATVQIGGAYSQHNSGHGAVQIGHIGSKPKKRRE